MNRRLTAILVGLVLISYAIAGPADSTRRDGNWWGTVDRGSKLAYIVGIYDGMTLGFNFSTWKYFDTTVPANKDAMAKATASYKEYVTKYASNTTNDQLVDGLDSFYSDYKNRRIEVWAALWLVMNGIAGKPKEQLEKMIEAWRQNATN